MDPTDNMDQTDFPTTFHTLSDQSRPTLAPPPQQQQQHQQQQQQQQRSGRSISNLAAFDSSHLHRLPPTSASSMTNRPRSRASTTSYLPPPPLPVPASLASPAVETSLVDSRHRTTRTSTAAAAWQDGWRSSRSRPGHGTVAPLDYFSSDKAAAAVPPSSHYAGATAGDSHLASPTASSLLQHPGVDSVKNFEQRVRRSLYRDERLEARGGASTGERDRLRPRAMPQISRTDHPQYPDQSFSALHNQIYPPPRRSPRESMASSSRSPGQPSPGLSPFMMLDSPSEKEVTMPRPVRTASSTPAQSPGPFHRYGRHLVADDLHDETSAHPSPYLHPTQVQPPKTVTNADKGIDSISGRKHVNHYEMLDYLGQGVHGKVKLARDLDTGQKVAIKIVGRFSKRKRLGKVTSPEDKVKKEIAILKKAQHPHVVRLIEVIDDPNVKKVYLVLEYCENGPVRWRTEGNTSVVILENRRLLQEAGVSQTGGSEDSPYFDNDHILELAAERTNQRKREAAMRLQRSKSLSEYWSLEHGGETTEEEDIYDDTPTPNARASQNKFVAAKFDSGELNSSSETPKAIPSTASKSSPNRPMSASPAEHRKSSSIGGSVDDPLESASSSLEQPASVRMMSQDPEYIKEFSSNVREALLRRGRQSSIADSETSQLTEIMEAEVSEDARFVPLMTIPECRAAFRDALVGLEYLHYHGIIHRDIKPENLLRTRDEFVKISDFGVSYLGKPKRRGADSTDATDASESESRDAEDDTELAKTVGTPAFYAPELCSLDLTPEMAPVTSKIDLWALGVTLYCLLFARTPFTAENEYALMKRIAEEDVFIPRHRLKALDQPASPRSSSSSHRHRLAPDRRLPEQFIHEEIDDDLYDLLKKLFIKDPRHRPTVAEVKHHPWVIKDIPDPAAWIDETDAMSFGQGKKIQISKEEVADAVIPLKVIERIKSLTGKASRALGLSGRSGRKRAPTQGSAASSDAGSSVSSRSAIGSDAPRVGTSSSPHARLEGRRSSLKTDESMYGSSKATRDRDAEHPLSKSQTASPDAQHTTRPYLASPGHETGDYYNSNSALSSMSDLGRRPPMPDRHASEWSNTGSIRTLRQSDIERGRRSSPPVPPLPAVVAGQRSSVSSPSDMSPENYHQYERSGGVSSTLGAIFGGAGRSFLRSVRSRDRQSMTSSSPARSYPSESDLSADHLAGEPSVALSNTYVSGRINTPGHLAKGDDLISYSTHSSPRSSAKESTEASSESLNALGARSLTHGSTPESSSRSLNRMDRAAQPDARHSPYVIPSEYEKLEREQNYEQAMDRLMLQREEERTLPEDPSSLSPVPSWPHGGSKSDPLSPFDLAAVDPPPRPTTRAQLLSTGDLEAEELPSLPGSVTGTASHMAGAQAPLQPLSPPSTATNNNTPVSQSASLPSIASAVSANSSLQPEESYVVPPPKADVISGRGGGHVEKQARTAAPRNNRDGTGLTPTSYGYRTINESAVIDSDNETHASDDSEEDFLIMNRRKSAGQSSRPSTQHSTGRPVSSQSRASKGGAGHKKPSDAGPSGRSSKKKASRSGSTNTVKKATGAPGALEVPGAPGAPLASVTGSDQPQGSKADVPVRDESEATG